MIYMEGMVTPMQKCLSNLRYQECGCDAFMLVILMELSMSCKTLNQIYIRSYDIM